MPDTHSIWRTDRPAEGFYTAEVAADAAPQTVRTFLPEGYEPRYPYPLLVLFHGHGGNEEQVLRLAPRMSRRNFVAISLRGPETVGTRGDAKPGYGWGTDGDAADRVADYLTRAVEQTRRTYHIHSERVYLVGVCEGAAAAYRAAFQLADWVAGVAALNGAVPRPNGSPLFRYDQVRRLRVMIGHGIANAVVPFSTAEQNERLFWAAGADARLTAYPTTHKLHPDMLTDVNKWVIGHVNAQHDLYVRR
jgi:phospholipase/carboxylesterase